uniref:Uncharacterized protein n=1 Tax=Fagus sylvatica TaxID=28930 RepID=A0A2N9GKY2_FAGSY
MATAFHHYSLQLVDLGGLGEFHVTGAAAAIVLAEFAVDRWVIAWTTGALAPAKRGEMAFPRQPFSLFFLNQFLNLALADLSLMTMGWASLPLLGFGLMVFLALSFHVLSTVGYWACWALDLWWITELRGAMAWLGFPFRGSTARLGSLLRGMMAWLGSLLRGMMAWLGSSLRGMMAWLGSSLKRHNGFGLDLRSEARWLGLDLLEVECFFFSLISL